MKQYGGERWQNSNSRKKKVDNISAKAILEKVGDTYTKQRNHAREKNWQHQSRHKNNAQKTLATTYHIFLAQLGTVLTVSG